MGIDLQTVFPTEILSLSSTAELGLSEGGRRQLLLTGEDFRSAEEVWVNDQQVHSLDVRSQTELQVELPDGMGADPVASVIVYSSRVTLNVRNILRFRLGMQPRYTTGILRLVQSFLMVLLKDPGRDIFDPDTGGGLMRMVSVGYGKSDSRKILQDVVLAVDRAKAHLVAKQSSNHSLALSEKLASAQLTNSTFDRNIQTLIVEVEVRSQTGKTGVANLAL
jgi:hypothetical protein